MDGLQSFSAFFSFREAVLNLGSMSWPEEFCEHLQLCVHLGTSFFFSEKWIH